jgi:hypothetical protein
MTSTFSLTYDLVGTGWSTCVVEAGDVKLELSASYLSDALGNLVLFAYAAASGFHSLSFGFDEEPGEYRWIAQAIDANLIKVRILEFQDLWGHKSNAEGRVLLDIDMPPLVLAEAVAKAADAVLEKYGLPGYAEKWAEHQFPEQQLSLLKSSIQQWRE